MKTADKETIIEGIEAVIGNGIIECEEADLTARKIYNAFIEPLVLAVQGDTRKA